MVGVEAEGGGGGSSLLSITFVDSRIKPFPFHSYLGLADNNDIKSVCLVLFESLFCVRHRSTAQ